MLLPRSGARFPHPPGAAFSAVKKPSPIVPAKRPAPPPLRKPPPQAAIKKTPQTARAKAQEKNVGLKLGGLIKPLAVAGATAAGGPLAGAAVGAGLTAASAAKKKPGAAQAMKAKATAMSAASAGSTERAVAQSPSLNTTGVSPKVMMIAGGALVGLIVLMFVLKR